LEKLNCYGCENLRKIPEIKTLKKLKCEDTIIIEILETT